MPKHRRKSRRRFRKRSSKPANTALATIRYFKHKCTAIIPIRAANSNYNFKDFVFSRYDYKGIVQDVYGINTPHRFDQVKANYEEYSVTGWKLKFIPSNIRGSVSADTSLSAITTKGSVNVLWFYEDVNTYNVA